MKYALLLWGLGGPGIYGIFESDAVCRGVLDRMDHAVKACVPIQVDKLVTDVVLYPHPNHLKE